jgi:hypothetical protein
MKLFSIFETSREILTPITPEISDPKAPPTHDGSDGDVI